VLLPTTKARGIPQLGLRLTKRKFLIKPTKAGDRLSRG
jgi:hypothetical protein